MHARIVFGCLAIASLACGRGTSIDELAREYVRLARMEGASDARYLDTLEQARARVASSPEQDGRRAFLLAQLDALARRTRSLAGQQKPIEDEAAALGMRVPTYDAARAAALRAEVDAALSGSGPLGARLAAHRRAHAVPRADLDRAARGSIEECRARTAPPRGLRDEGVALRYVIDIPWLAFTTHAADAASVVEVRRDVAWLEDDLLTVLCHETYPGHHLQNLVWDDLRRAKGWEELSVTPMFTPLAVTAERAANAATALVVLRGQRSPVSRALDDLAPLALATAVGIVDGRLDRDAGLARLRDDLLMPDAAGFVRFVEEYRAMAVAYVTPLADVNDWDDYYALLRSPERLAGAADSPAGLRTGSR
jgi:hypothetical protein